MSAARAALVTEAPSTVRRRRPPRVGRRVLLAAGIALGMLLVAGAWLGIRGWLAVKELEDVAALQPRLAAAMSAGDAAALQSVAEDARSRAARAADLTSDPIWRATEALPAAGANTAAVRVVAESVRDVAGAAVAALGAAAPAAKAPDGLNLAAIDAMAAPLGAFAESVSRADAVLRTIPADGLVTPLRVAVTRVQGAVADAAPGITDATAVARVLPAILGADGPRSLLIMIQNSAEVRTGGGITGSFIALDAVDGRLDMVDHVDSSDFGSRADSIAPLPAELVALYGAAPGRFVMNATMTPDFSLSAQLATAWWQTLGRAAPDAVVAIDPSVLTAMLAITGPITLRDGTVVDSADVVENILVRPYLEMSPAGQAAIQRDLTDRLFAQLTAQAIDPMRWVSALSAPAAEGRISVWSAHPDEEAVLSTSPLGGMLARLRAAGPDAVGVYVNDATTGKMDSYLHASIAPTVRTCRADGAAAVTIAVTLRSDAPEAAREFNPSMTGWFNPSAPGDITTDVAVGVPAGWFLGQVRLGDAPVTATGVDAGDSPTSLARVTLAPGEERVLAFDFVAKQGTGVQPAIVHTPMLNEVTVAPTAHPGCS